MDGATGDNILGRMAEVQANHFSAAAVLGQDAIRPGTYSRDRQFKLRRDESIESADCSSASGSKSSPSHGIGRDVSEEDGDTENPESSEEPSQILRLHISRFL